LIRIFLTCSSKERIEVRGVEKWNPHPALSLEKRERVLKFEVATV
jgi:hypothetical protein